MIEQVPDRDFMLRQSEDFRSRPDQEMQILFSQATQAPSQEPRKPV